MGRLIDETDLMNLLCALDDARHDLCYAIKKIPELPEVDAIPKAEYEARFKTGKWIVHRKSDGEVGYFQCSSCNHHSVVKFPYCPICGAEMDCNPNILSEMKAIPKDIYEARLKADMVAMLTEIQLEIEELKNEPACCQHFVRGVRRSSEVIQQKIEQLKGEE